MKIDSYDSAFRFLLEFVDYEKVTKFKYDIATFDLERVKALMAAVGDPHESFRSVHIAGTKGKGSTAMMVQSMLTGARLRTGLFTSPHLVRLEERMTIDGELMPESELIALVNEIAPYTLRMRSEQPNESPTYFELVTTLAFMHFARSKVDFAAVEVGMGGRLDSTNVITPEVSVITRVDYDHVERLGHTLDKIAYEKGGIIKSGVPVVCAPQEPEAEQMIVRIAEERNAPLILIGRDYRIDDVKTGVEAEGAYCRFNLVGPKRRYNELHVGLLGEHQAVNAAGAVAAAEMLEERSGVGLGEEKIRRGLAAVVCPARSEFFPGSPMVLLDGAHNPISIRSLCRTLESVFAGRRVIFLMGFSSDKDIPGMLRLIAPHASELILTDSTSPRAEEPEVLMDLAKEVCGLKAQAVAHPEEAFALACSLANEDDIVCIAGSFYLAGRLRASLVERALSGREF